MLNTTGGTFMETTLPQMGFSGHPGEKPETAREPDFAPNSHPNAKFNLLIYIHLYDLVTLSVDSRFSPWIDLQDTSGRTNLTMRGVLNVTSTQPCCGGSGFYHRAGCSTR